MPERERVCATETHTEGRERETVRERHRERENNVFRVDPSISKELGPR